MKAALGFEKEIEMMKFQKFAVVAAPALALTMLAAAPADAQSR